MLALDAVPVDLCSDKLGLWRPVGNACRGCLQPGCNGCARVVRMVERSDRLLFLLQGIALDLSGLSAPC